MTAEELKALPKVELHCHLDGSLSHTFIEKRLGRKVSQSELSVSEDCRSLNEYLQKFDLPGKCIMNEAGLQEAGYDVLRSMKQENVCYAEIRFAPLLSETQDMNCNKVIEALLNGLERGKKDFGIEYGVITCAMRHHSEEENARMIRTARAYLGYGVCAADLAGAESLYPMSEFMELFKKTKALGMPFTLHAGECGSVQNILDSVEAGAGRIGHGIAMRGHADIQKELQKKGIGIEMCPISNLQTKAVESSAAQTTSANASSGTAQQTSPVKKTEPVKSYSYDKNSKTFTFELNGNTFKYPVSAAAIKDLGYIYVSNTLSSETTTLDMYTDAYKSTIMVKYNAKAGNTSDCYALAAELKEGSTFMGLSARTDYAALKEAFKNADREVQTDYRSDTGTGIIQYMFGDRRISVTMDNGYVTGATIE